MVSSETNINTPDNTRTQDETVAEPLAPDEVWTTADARYWTAAIALLCLGIALRQLWLAEFPFHPDEAIHAWFPLNFAGYNYDPVYHGPLLYHLQAAVYSIVGPYDYTARLMPSLLGIALLAVVIGPARRYLGDRAALWSLGLIAISPVILTYQRRLLHDSLVLLLTLGAVLCFQQARENASDTEAGRNARIGLVVLLALFVATKANAFFIIAMLVAFWMAVKLKSWLRPKFADPERLSTLRDVLAAWLLPVVCLILAGLSLYVIMRLRNVEPPPPVADWIVPIASVLATVGLDISVIVQHSKLLTASLVPLVLILTAFGWFVAYKAPRRAEVFRTHFWTWLPAIMLFFVAVASVLAVRHPAEWKDIIEPVYALTCVLCVGVVWLWLIIAPRGLAKISDEDAAKSSQNEGVQETQSSLSVQSTPDGFAAPRRRDLATPALAGWAGLFVFAFLFGHGFLWWRVPLQMVQHTATWAQATGDSAQAIGTAAAQPLASVLRGDFGSVRDAAKSVVTDHLQPDGAKPGPGILVSAPDWYNIGHAVPKMIAYWGKQQQDPRLPGRHDYHIVLMLLYELPIVLVGLGGLVHAGRHRTPFTDLLLWWTFTSFTLYALANEKVPWLLTHIMLPWALLGGVWLAQQIRLEGGRRVAMIAACVLGAIYLGRGAIATNFERAVDKHEPMFYAQTSEKYRDALFEAMRKTQNNNGLIWMHNELQWPTVWYTREGAPLRNESPVTFTPDPGNELLRMAISKPDVWEQNERFRRWTGEETNFYIWPRASWPALSPPVWARFWWTRDATQGLLAHPGESPGAAIAIIGTPPCVDEPCY